MNQNIQGKVVVITGASSGLGKQPPATLQRWEPPWCSVQDGWIS